MLARIVTWEHFRGETLITDEVDEKAEDGCAEAADANVSDKPEADVDGAMDVLLAHHHIRRALTWLNRQPWARTLALRQIMEPNLNLIKTKVWQSSARARPI